jgi:acyl transferase domain-containing protein/acyl carrier protein
MTENQAKNDYRALLQQSLVALEQMQAKLRAAEDAQHEALAIIGMGLRFPGDANDAQSFWQLLLTGTDAISEVPPNRWDVEQFFDTDPDAIGKMYTKWGGFLKNIDQFDPQFFSISPREAISMDPQQRLLLETTWEALENAGQASARLAGSRTGVFVGMVGSDYANLKISTSSTTLDVDAYFGSGISRSIASGRISYTFGLHGPAVTVDTACSSSLVAVHQACQSLRLKECDMAIAGGVNLILDPFGMITTSRARMMSFDGRCKTFDAAADGYVRSEGCAMIVLKRLSSAQADGDPILAVILGTAMNQDGRSNGLTAPNGKAQEAVIRAALEDARRKPAEISFVETHGTGTTLGDPIEVRALGAVYGEGRSAERPLMIGSVKTNVGHLEAAAGIVGLVKVVLALQNKCIPPHIHLKNPNPYIPWESLPVTIPTQAVEWSTPDGIRRVASLSSFGFSGTNTHMILAEPPARKAVTAGFERTTHLFTLSAKTAPALQALAERCETWLKDNPQAAASDVACSLNSGRAHFERRLCFTAASLSEAQQKLAAWQHDPATAGVLTGTLDGKGKPEIAFLFTGQGAQYPGMARQLFDSQPAFRKSMQQCEALLRQYLEKPLLAVIYPENSQDGELLHQTAYTQPALFALEYSLAKLWQSWGVEPAVVMGHSIGEYVAACLAGVFSLEDGLKLVAARGRLMQSLPAGGVMAAVFAGESQVHAALAPYVQTVAIAAVNGPHAVVISGQAAAVEAILENLKATGVQSQRLNVSHAFHSPLIDPILAQFEEVARSVQYQPLQISLVSNVTGQQASSGQVSNAAYWVSHMRQAVRFADGVKTLQAEGCRFYLEIGPNPTLLGMARRCEPAQPQAVWLPSLRSGRGDWEQMLESLGQLYVHGQAVNWETFERDYRAQRQVLPLPTYPFQRSHYWMDFSSAAGAADSNKLGDTTAAIPGTDTGHPLLGRRLATAAPLYQQALSAEQPSYLADHIIHGITILPASAYIEIALAAACNLNPGERVALADFAIYEALPFPEGETVTAQLILSSDENGSSTSAFQYFSQPAGAQPGNWRRHASGRLITQPAQAVPTITALNDLRAQISEPFPVEAYYAHLAEAGAEYGPAFRALTAAWRAEGQALGKIELPEAAPIDERYALHPALLDACIQLLGAAVPGAGDIDQPANNRIYVPVAIEQVVLYAGLGRAAECHVQLRPAKQANAPTLTADMTIFDSEGQPAAVLTGLVLQQVDRQALRSAIQGSVEPWLYEIEWSEQARGLPQVTWQGNGAWLLLADDRPFSHELAALLAAKGETCWLAHPGDSFARLAPNRWQLNPLQPQDFTNLMADIHTAGQPPLRGVIHAWGLGEAIDDQDDLQHLHDRLAPVNAGALHLTQALLAHSGALPRLWLLTAGAQAIDSREGVNPAAASLWGLGNVIALEQPALNCVRVDLDPRRPDAAALLEEIWAADDEDQVALRGSTRRVARLVHAAKQPTPPGASQPVTLVIRERGTLENLALQPLPHRQPGPGEVAIAVHATGLNFRDVLNTLGMYPGDAGPLGSECAGVISALGAGVTDFRIGDAVIALASSSFASTVIVSSNMVVPMPGSLSFTQAATIPIAFLTADYALNRLAGMKAGDRVLIHAATGGVGMAAVQLAHRAGAEIYATAGSPEKRAFLESLGIQHIFNSRTLDFADQIEALTNGEGVDIVLNSLSGEFIPKSLAVLKENGCFIEIGKTDVWDLQRARTIKPGLRYHVLYLGENLEKEPLLVRGMLLDLLADFQKGILQPLPQQVYPLEKAQDAFRFMAQARHIGKIVLTQQQAGQAVTTILPAATYLITGGLGGLGLATAHWLVEQGARHLLLLGRSQPSEQAQQELAALQAAGAEIQVAQVDVAQCDGLEQVLQHAAASMPPLRGVIHAAGVLDDGILMEQNWPRFLGVMAPKVDGAWNLHQATLHSQLDFFIVYSAGASLLGSAGQSNYAAANAFLDGLAHYRRACGLPAAAINWGAWAEVGMAARLGEQILQRWAEQGIAPIRPADGLRAMQQILLRQSVQAAVLPINWQRLKRQPQEASRPLLRKLIGRETAGSQTAQRDVPLAGQVSFLEQLRQAAPEEQLKLVSQRVTEEVNKVLGLTPQQRTNPRQGFTDLGLDSLMAVELSNRLQKVLERRLPATLTFEHPTIEALTNYLAVEVLAIAAPAAAEMPAETGGQAQALMAEVERISDDEVEDALLKELKDAGY